MIDTHSHINTSEYKYDVVDIIERARENGILGMVAVGVDIETSMEAIRLSKEFSNIYPTAGIHPSELKNVDFKALEDILKDKRIIAVGECGIDLYWQKDNLVEQIKIFTAQIELAVKYGLPLIIHTRNSFKETYEVLLPYKGKVAGVFHCFSGTLEEAHQAINLGFYLGIGGVVTFKNAIELKRIVKEIDIKYLLLETDCPYLAPMPYRGKRNEPSYLKYIIECIAQIKGVSIEEVDEITTYNAKKLFEIEVKKWKEY